MNQQFSRPPGVTLIELLLSILLLSVVIMTGLSLELGLRRLFVSTDVESQLLDEATPILAMITRDINRGIGDFVNAPYSTTAIGGDVAYWIRVDSNNNAQADTSDRWVVYRYRDAASADPYQIWRYPDYAGSSTTYIVLTNHSIGPGPSLPVNGVTNITLRLRKDPAQAASVTNPEVVVNASAQFRGYSLS